MTTSFFTLHIRMSPGPLSESPTVGSPTPRHWTPRLLLVSLVMKRCPSDLTPVRGPSGHCPQQSCWADAGPPQLLETPRWICIVLPVVLLSSSHSLAGMPQQVLTGPPRCQDPFAHRRPWALEDFSSLVKSIALLSLVSPEVLRPQPAVPGAQGAGVAGWAEHTLRVGRSFPKACPAPLAAAQARELLIEFTLVKNVHKLQMTA